MRVGAQVQPLECYLSSVEIGCKIQFYCQFSTDGNYPKFSDTHFEEQFDMVYTVYLLFILKKLLVIR